MLSYVTSSLLSLALPEGQVFFYLLIACKIINSCYTLLWDLKMDWGLFDRNAGENTLLREEIVYPQKVRIHTLLVFMFYYLNIFKENSPLHRRCVDLCALFEQAYYYCAIIEDVILRFAWTIPLSLGVVTTFPNISDILATVLAPLEVFRWVHQHISIYIH